MAKLNTSVKSTHVTHEGAQAKRINAEQQLRRSVMSCLLWEKEFYEDGESIFQRIKETIPLVDAKVVAAIAIEARTKMKLRHVPLAIVREMARIPSHKALVAATLEAVIQRADELTEFLAIYSKDGREKLSAQVKRGLAKAFVKFSAYDLAKYNRDGKYKLRDVLFLTHAKPKDDEQAAVWKKLVDGTLESPDTWEVALSSGADKKETWTRLVKEKKLGALAFLRNLRNMQEAKIGEQVIRDGLGNIDPKWVLPFRFIAASRFVPQFEPELETLLFKCVQEKPKLRGKTVVLVDVSGSMDSALSDKSDMQRLDAACGLAMVMRELCEQAAILSFSNQLCQIAPRRGFALRDAIVSSQPHSGTELGGAVTAINQNMEYDRIIVITDEQSRSACPNAKGIGYMINVASAKNGIGYGAWNHFDGFSEAIVDYVIASERDGSLG